MFLSMCHCDVLLLWFRATVEPTSTVEKNDSRACARFVSVFLWFHASVDSTRVFEKQSLFERVSVSLIVSYGFARRSNQQPRWKIDALLRLHTFHLSFPLVSCGTRVNKHVGKTNRV